MKNYDSEVYELLEEFEGRKQNNGGGDYVH